MEIRTKKRDLLVSIEAFGCKVEVVCNATQSYNGETSQWFAREFFEVGSELLRFVEACDWNEIPNLSIALKSIDEKADYHESECNVDGNTLHIYQL
tara:strand:+ start:854 stop:1141 length:288 start_codon:yes stop_codon:yes gene_type:complete